jgi:hypothetical protein
MLGFPTGLSQNKLCLDCTFFWGNFLKNFILFFGFSSFFYCYILGKNKNHRQCQISIYKDSWIVYLHILCIAKIWLNFLVDDHQFRYITTLCFKNTSWVV